MSRAFGDIEAKHPYLGGNPNVLTAVPEIRCFEINHETDFLIMGCDGIFEKLTNDDVQT